MDLHDATRRRWPSRCVSCAACRWRSPRRSTTATAATRTIPTPGDAVPLSRCATTSPISCSTAACQWEKGVCRLYVDATNITDTRYCDLGGIPPARRVGHGRRGADHRPLTPLRPRSRPPHEAREPGRSPFSGCNPARRLVRRAFLSPGGFPRRHPPSAVFSGGCGRPL